MFPFAATSWVCRYALRGFVCKGGLSKRRPRDLRCGAAWLQGLRLLSAQGLSARKLGVSRVSGLGFKVRVRGVLACRRAPARLCRASTFSGPVGCNPATTPLDPKPLNP